MSFKWTKEQDNAINTPNSDLIVAASAGSGKTSAMVARALTLVTKGTPIERILMLTFGEAAAAEMKEKLREKLISYAKGATCHKKFLVEQIDNMARADICTIHSFCKSIVKNNFEAVDINPSFEMADDETAKILARKAIKSLLQRETAMSNPSFVELRDMISPRNDSDLINIIFKIYEHMSTQADRYGWLESTFDAEYSAAFENSKAVKYIIEYLTKKALPIKERICKLQNSAVLLNETPFVEYAVYLFGKIDGYTKCATLKDFYIERERIKTLGRKNLTSSHKISTLYDRAVSLKEDIADFNDIIKKSLGNQSYAEAKRINIGSSAQIAELIRLLSAYDEEYTKIKKENDILDFADLEKFALVVLKDEEKRREIQSNYDYVFVDEYQDTNYVQERIISLITPPNSLFVVGDSKQSIYRFRLAEPAIFLEKLKILKEKNKAIYFNDNFRSSPEILTFVNDVFNELMSNELGGVDYKADEAFNIPPDKGKVSNYPAVEIIAVSPLEAEREEDKRAVYSVKNADKYTFKSKGVAEGRLIAERIMRLVATEHIKLKDEVRLIDYQDITIMFKKRSHANGIISELIKCGIPLKLGKFAVSEQSEDVTLVINYLKLLSNRKEDYTLLAVMHSPIGSFTNIELAEIRKRVGGRQPFYEAVTQCAECEDELGVKIKNFYETLDKYEFEAQYTDVVSLARKIINESGYTDYVSSLSGGLDRLIVLEYFLSGIEGKAYSKSVASFVGYYAEHEEDIDWSKGDISASEGVNICTIHSSKGLEYPVVILAGSACAMNGHGQNVPVFVDKDLGIGAYYYDDKTRCKIPSAVMTAIAIKKQEEEKEDSLRLLYVALTRAQSHLIITAETNADNNKAINRAASYFDWITNVASNNKRVAALVKMLGVKEDIEQKNIEKPIFFGKPIDSLRDMHCKEFDYKYPYQESTNISIKYSVTGINKEEDIIIPSIFEEERRILGVDYHKIMQYISYDDATIEGVKKDIERLIEEGIIDAKETADVNLGLISKCLSTDIMRYAADNKCFREKRFLMSAKANEIKSIEADDLVIIQGTIDLLILGDMTVIVDFKYSNLPEKVIAEKYRKQLEIYKIAVESAMNIKVDKLIIYIFGSNSVIEL